MSKISLPFTQFPTYFWWEWPLTASLKMLPHFYVPRLSNHMKIAVEENHLGGLILYRSLDPSKKWCQKQSKIPKKYLKNSKKKLPKNLKFQKISTKKIQRNSQKKIPRYATNCTTYHPVSDTLFFY